MIDAWMGNGAILLLSGLAIVAVVYFAAVRLQKSANGQRVSELAQLDKQAGKSDFTTTTPPQRFPTPPEQDNWETDWLINLDGEMPIELDAFIHYRDGSGLETKRQIHIKALYPYEGDLAILAFCQLRQANRSFRVSRIIEFTDLSTGEIAKNARDYLLNAYGRSPYGSTEKVISNLADDLAILLFIGRTEHDVLSPKRRKCIFEYLQTNAEGRNVDDVALAKLLSKKVPNKSDFREALNHISSERCSSILIAIERLIHVFSKRPDEMQQGAIDFAVKNLKSRATPST